MRTIALVAGILSATCAFAETTVGPLSEQTFVKYEVYNSDGKTLAVSVDYRVGRSCGKGYEYKLTPIDEETAIVTKRALPRRAFCPPPASQPIVEEGIRFELKKASGFDFTFQYLMIPKDSELKVEELKVEKE
jgi:hypothetical protein